MTCSTFLGVAAALALGGAALPAAAQEMVQPLPGTTTADRLGDVMRRVATDPQDVDALTTAGALSLELGDLSGAASLYARAAKVSPNDGRVRAGMGAILVRSERPGEALRYFQLAEAARYPVANFAADRGFAYDLTGQQGLAQQDYRTSLAAKPGDDETTRRYALSLGISGAKDRALALLNPLLQKSDRAAWRARAFVLAMNGDVNDAETIATTMMPGAGTGLLPFFQRLPSLDAVDRAFAVHFGEVRPTPERLADARLAPPVVAVAPEPVALAAATPIVPTAVRGAARRERRRHGETVPAVAPTPVSSVTPVEVAALAPPVRVVTVADATRRTPDMTSVAPTRAALASAQPTPIAQPVPSTIPVPSPSPAPVVVVAATQSPSGAVAVPATASLAQARTAEQANRAIVASTPAPMSTFTPSSTPTSPSVPMAVVARTGDGTPAAAPAGAMATVQIASAATSKRTAAVRTPARAPLPASAAIPRHAIDPADDAVLARIIAGLSIPASELGVGPRERPARLAAAEPVSTPAEIVDEARAKTARDAAAKRVAEAKVRHAATAGAATSVDGDVVASEAGRTDRQHKGVGSTKTRDASTGDRAADVDPTRDRKASARQAATDRKASADRKAAADRKLADAKAAADARKAERANPSRIWVQVAGGANEDDLPKAYAAVKAKASTVLGSRAAYATPLRATNRVLVGPFKTDEEARAFVNTLAKKGISGFPFTSDKGQPVTKLPPR